MDRFLRIGAVAQQLHVTTQTVRRYVTQGKLRADKTPGGRYTFQQSYIDDFLGKDTEKIIAFYTRSSDGDKVKLDTQEKLLREYCDQPVRVYSDKASGLNEKRPGLMRVLRDAKKGNFTHLAVTQRDRLARFGTHYLESLLNEYGVELIVTQENQDKSAHDELMQDFMSLVASFSGRFYSLRGHENARKLLKEAESRLS